MAKTGRTKFSEFAAVTLASCRRSGPARPTHGRAVGEFVQVVRRDARRPASMRTTLRFAELHDRSWARLPRSRRIRRRWRSSESPGGDEHRRLGGGQPDLGRAEHPGVTRASAFGNKASIVIAREFGSIATFNAETEPAKSTPGYPETSAWTGRPRRTLTASTSLTSSSSLIGWMRTMVATFAAGVTYSPAATGRAVT